MRHESSPSTSCETAAERVQYWFGKDKISHFHADHGGHQRPDFCKKHTCRTVKTPGVPQRCHPLPLLAKRKKEMPPRHIAKGDNLPKPLQEKIDGSYCNVNQKTLDLPKPENTLSSARVAHCTLKEYFLVSKRLKNLRLHSNHAPKFHHVVSIKSSSRKDLSKNPYFEEWEKTKVERHFHLGRVIKYFTV